MFSEKMLMSLNVEFPYLIPAQLPSIFEDPITVLLSHMINFQWCLLQTSLVMYLQIDFLRHWGFSTIYFPPAFLNYSISSLLTHSCTLSMKRTTCTPRAAASVSLQRVVSAAGEESIAYVVIQKQSLALSMMDHSFLKNSSPSVTNLVSGNLIIDLRGHWEVLRSYLLKRTADLWKGWAKI